ncbi:MAG: hypothetical protein AAGL89_01920 [Pseudomonadota bacterium]
MLNAVIFAAACGVGLIALDRILQWVLPKIGHLLPNDYCGPDGWLTDTRAASGIFDRPVR